MPRNIGKYGLRKSPRLDVNFLKTPHSHNQEKLLK